MKSLWIIVAMFVLMLGRSSYAETAKSEPRLTQFVQNEVKVTSFSLNAPLWGRREPSGPMKSENWAFKRFFFQVYAKFAFVIPFFAKLELVPELELVWQREAN